MSDDRLPAGVQYATSAEALTALGTAEIERRKASLRGAVILDIEQVAWRYGVNVATIEYWERIGQLPAPVTDADIAEMN